MAKIKNEKKEIDISTDMNDMNYLNDILQGEKDLSNNYSIAINEMSNKVLFKKIMTLFDQTKEMSRELYNLAFEYGWYTLETASEDKITQAFDEANKEKEEI